MKIYLIILLNLLIIKTSFSSHTDDENLLKRNACLVELTILNKKTLRLQDIWLTNKKSPQNINKAFKSLSAEYQKIWQAFASEIKRQDELKNADDILNALKSYDQENANVITLLKQLATKSNNFLLSLNSIRSYIDKLNAELKSLETDCPEKEKLLSHRLLNELQKFKKKIKRMELFVTGNSRKMNNLVEVMLGSQKERLVVKYSKITSKRIKDIQKRLSKIAQSDNLIEEMTVWYSDQFVGKGLCSGNLFYYLRYEPSYRCLTGLLSTLDKYKGKIASNSNSWTKPFLEETWSKFHGSINIEYENLLKRGQKHFNDRQIKRLESFTSATQKKCKKEIDQYKKSKTQKEKDDFFKSVVDKCKTGGAR